MHKQINKINPENADNESDIIFKLEKLIEKISRKSKGKCIKSRIGGSRKSQQTEDQYHIQTTLASEPFTSQTSEQRVETKDEPLSITDINFEEPVIILRTDQKNIYRFKKNYHIYSFKCVVDAYRINFFIYTSINLAIAAYIGNSIAGIFGFSGVFWILVLILVRVTIDASIICYYLGNHEDRLIAPSMILTINFSFIAILIFLYHLN